MQKPMSYLELRIPPVAVLFACLAGQRLSAYLFPTFKAVFPGQALLSIGLAVLGAAVALAGVLAFREAKTTVDPTKPELTATVLRSAVYRVSRNPMYLGFALVLMGLGAALGNAPALLMIPTFVLYIERFQIVPEERFLFAKFGIDYERYRQETRRWI
jgi:protein-S-isoprenylcysteine O-methyltransferase Ste14